MKIVMPNEDQRYFKVIEGTHEAYVYYNPDNKSSAFEIRMNNDYSITPEGGVYIRDDNLASGWTEINIEETKLVITIIEAYNSSKLKMTEWYNECSTDTSNRETVICPYCGEDCTEEYAGGWRECHNCGKEFECHSNVTITYTTSKMEEIDGTS